MRRAWQEHEVETQGGFIFVFVLWLLLALATMTTVYSLYLSNSALALSVYDDRLETESAMSSALELVKYRLSDPNKAVRPTHGTFSFRLRTLSVTVKFLNEAARIDLNTASKDMLSGLFAVVGASPADANNYAEHVIGWRTQPKAGIPSDEDGLYRAAGMAYEPRGAPFAHVNELFLVYGIPVAIAERAAEYLTVYSGRSDVDIREAAPEVIAALPGMTPGRLNAFLAARESITDPKLLLNDIGGPQSGAGTEGSDGVRVNISVRFDNGAQSMSEAVIFLGEPYRILSWREDGAMRPAGAIGK